MNRRAKEPLAAVAALLAKSERAPDLLEPVLGWRLWLLVEEGGYLWVESVLYPTRWWPRRAVDASCAVGGRRHPSASSCREALPAHVAPHPGCECGVYAVRTPDALLPYLDSAYSRRVGSGFVLGRVRLWGTVIAGERGWRAEHAYPDAFYLPGRGNGARVAAAALGDYLVPVEIVDPREAPVMLSSLREAAA